MAPELIDSIASLWKLGAVIVLFAALALFSNPIRSFLGRINSLRYRRGDTEVAVNRETEPLEVPKATAVAEVAAAKGVLNWPVNESVAQEPKHLISDMVEAFFDRDLERAEEVYKRLVDSEPNAVSRLRYEASYCALRYMQAGDQKALASLNALAENPAVRSKVCWWLGRCHEQSNHIDDALAAYEQAISSSQSDEERSENTASLASCLLLIGEANQAVERLVQALKDSPRGEPQAALYRQLARVEKERGNKLNEALAFEMVAFNCPEDTAERFAAAYAQDEAGLDHLTCTNYDTLLRFDPGDRAALNNLGVTLSKLQMPIRSVESYQKAFERGNTLAAANLAFALLSAGFAKEAEELVNSALRSPKPHENVGKAMADIREKIESEARTMQTVVQRGVQQQRFFHSFYPTSLNSKPVESIPSGEWFVGSVPVQVTMEGTTLVLEWGSGTDRRRVEGNLSNRAGTVKVRKWEKIILSDQWRFDSGFGAYAYFNEDISCLTILSTETKEGWYAEAVRKQA